MPMKSQSGNILYRNYSSYRTKASPSKKSQKSKKSKNKSYIKVLAAAVVIAVIFSIPVYAYFHVNNPYKPTTNSTLKTNTPKTILPKATAAVPAVSTEPTACSSNTLDELIIVSISQRHLWACQGDEIVYDTPVVTGDMNVVEDVTPVGTYHIYGKYTDMYLNGSDSRGSWHDYVNYWMPFLDNQYGTFGLHDATWRTASDFGNISPYSDDASHGCVELPLAAAKWLFNWDSIGTTVTIES
jgi:lipoprotein-anchoring transpeptidase ErfK/SrfK